MERQRLRTVLASTFKKQEGPFVKALDKALQSFRVHRQAYYSGTFVGNHVHSSLKVSNHHNRNCNLISLPNRRPTSTHCASPW